MVRFLPMSRHIEMSRYSRTTLINFCKFDEAFLMERKCVTVVPLVTHWQTLETSVGGTFAMFEKGLGFESRVLQLFFYPLTS